MNTNIRILIILFIIFSSCQKREWNNPFDPECPKEIWTPTAFASIQQGNAINLTWAQPIKNISGFRIERKIEGEATWTEVTSPAKTLNAWTDPGITGGKLYEYRIVALAGNNESNYASVQITPLLTATLTTTIPSAITATSAILGGTITTDGGAPITERGVCWATTTGPTTSNSKLAIGSGTGSFSNTITGLTANTTYYVRAYAINNQGTAYGNELSFKTSVILSLATLTTNAATNIASTSAIMGGNVTSDGNTAVTERGVVYATTQTPTTANTKVAIGTGTGNIIIAVSGLTANTTYYVRAYAINSQGTAYGNEVSFKTVSSVISLPTVTTNAVTEITGSSATCGGNVTSDGGASVTSKGVCWGTSSNPIYGVNTSNYGGTGTGSFSCLLPVLDSDVTYYVRAYATNSIGTAYGNEVSFKTTASGTQTVTDIDGNIYHTVTIGTQVWMVENLKTTKYNDGTAIPNVTDNTAWLNLTTPGYCWYNNDAPTYKSTYGALYNWYSVNTGKLCPTGWHVPTDAEWTTLTTYLGGEAVAGGKMKETGTIHWYESPVETSNSSGFTAIPGGMRYYNDGIFKGIGITGIWWSSSENSSNSAWCRYFFYATNDVSKLVDNKPDALSVRCLKN